MTGPVDQSSWVFCTVSVGDALVHHGSLEHVSGRVPSPSDTKAGRPLNLTLDGDTHGRVLGPFYSFLPVSDLHVFHPCGPLTLQTCFGNLIRTSHWIFGLDFPLCLVVWSPPSVYPSVWCATPGPMSRSSRVARPGHTVLLHRRPFRPHPSTPSTRDRTEAVLREGAKVTVCKTLGWIRSRRPLPTDLFLC